MNITEKSIERLQPGKERQNFRDDELTGFGIRIEPVSSGGRKSFFWNAKVCGQVVFKSLGESPTTSVKDARDRAREWAGKAAKWKQEGCPEESNPFAKQRRDGAAAPTFSELCESYIENHLRGNTLNPTTAEYQVRLLLKNHFATWLDRRIDEITVDDVLAAKNACGKQRHIANSCVEFARRVYNWSAGSRDGKCNFWKVENPAKDVSLYSKEKRKRFLQPDELLTLNAELEKPETPGDLRDFVTLALATGARKSNIYAMTWKDVNFEAKSWFIPMSKSGEGYQVNLTPAAINVLERRRHETPDSEPFVFPSNSESGHIVDVKKQWTAFRTRCGLPDVRIHDLRRTRGSYLAISGTSLQVIAATLGHKSLGSTAIYAQLHGQAIREALDSSDATMKRMMKQAKKRLKAQERKPRKLLAAGRA